ncbi:hypothetical protein MmiEs2_11620 [Methanimicrococcus stummii]|uniref:DUF5666 domain-containing protein n=1 Tax=Methanimicrococcus stummii TaxID=3028294 RepID=A0AA96V9A4_9EURY|nr:hypothetical protein [Methanimicrococcus sp. Es2]WNY28949.1 hypothetical protein MmiEs2_11620 [Methanimicrococcus sp. Es2]
MKKQFFLIGLCLVLGAVLVAGCLGGDDAGDSNATVPAEPIAPPADAARYRGNVTGISVTNNETIMTLEKVKGTGGDASMNFVFGDNSKANFNLTDLKIGQYIEVYYGIPAGDVKPDPATVIVANVLQNADMVVYSGEIVNVTPAVDVNNSTYVGKLEVKLENNTTMIFNCGNSTQFYMNMSDVTAGTKVSIYANWIIQTSMPPQTTAYEVSKYVD